MFFIEYSQNFLEGVWERRILTHNGPLVQKLEKNISKKISFLKSFYCCD